MKKKKNNIFKLLLLILIIVGGLAFLYNKNIKENELKIKENTEKILSYYNEFIITNKDTTIYTFDNEKVVKVGFINKGQELVLEKDKKIYNESYFKITNFDKEYYIYYKDVKSIEELSINNDRYKNYILFNENIITKNITEFYDKEGNLIYSFNESFDLPIIIKKEDMYGVEFNNKLLYVKKNDINNLKESDNTDLTNTSGIAVLNYHFFFDDSDKEEVKDCNQSICLSTTKLKTHLDYIKDNKIFTPTMEELEMYIDGYIQLPKSVVLTIDDGWRADIGTKIMNDYQINATVFLITSEIHPSVFKDNYIEVHSHGDNLHKGGVCPGGQGGAIKCLDKSKLLSDLKISREKLNNSTVFCYPFYEYNNYSIEVLKEAGFTMAFGGHNEAGNTKIKPGINKYKLPRYVIYNTTTANNIANYIG